MGLKQSKHDLTNDNINEAEMQVLLLSGLPESQIHQMNVKVGEHRGEDVYIHTVVCGDHNPWKKTSEVEENK